MNRKVVLGFTLIFLFAVVAPPAFALQINGHQGDNDIFAPGAGDGASAPGVILGNALSCCLQIGENLFGSRSGVAVMAFELPALSPSETIANAVLTYTMLSSIIAMDCCSTTWTSTGWVSGRREQCWWMISSSV